MSNRNETGSPATRSGEEVTFRTILIVLIGLLAADCILTSIAVGRLGATEMNPLYYAIGGLHTFIAIKVLASVVAIAAIVLVERMQPTLAACTAACCCGMYGGLLLLNVGEIIQ